MLEVVNTYLHGFAATALLSACDESGIFEALQAGPVHVDEVAQRLSANPGYCRLFFRALDSLAIVESDDSDRYLLTSRYAEFAHLPPDLGQLYELDYAAFLDAGHDVERVRRWLLLSAGGWDGRGGMAGTLLDGAILVPLLLALARAERETPSRPGESQRFDAVHETARPLIHTYLQSKQLILPGDTFALSQEGQYLCERALTMAVNASYRPLLMQLRELLLGDPRKVFAADDDGHERHIDRRLNVVGSGFQHDLFFQDMVDLVVHLFDRTPLEQQPRCIVDMGCGDGTLLRTLYTAIAARSRRGRHLDAYPLLMVGADFNARALDASAKTLHDVPHALLRGDISQPQQLLHDLAALGIGGRDDILHVRSFLDHDRPLNLRAGHARRTGEDLSYVDAVGGTLTAAQVDADLQAHLQRWGEAIGRHGLVLIEVFALPVATTRKYFRETVSFTFDLLHALSRQTLVEATTFQQALAGAGLFAEPASLVRYPKTTPFTRIVLQHVKRKAFAIRSVQQDDVAALQAIDHASWPQNLWLTAQQIRARGERYPAGQFAIDCNGTLAGVLHTQRIDDLDGLLRLRYADYGQAHADQGRYLLLLGISVHPAYQSLALGDRLIEHALDLAALTSGVEAVYGVTRCLDYAGRSEPLPDYIARRDAQGHSLDRLLRFHQSHGAIIERVVPDARPEDSDNGAAGVLIRYDVAERLSGLRAQAPALSSSRLTDSVAQTVAEIVRRRMKHPENFAAHLAFKELGLDSMSLMELRLGLVKQFSLAFEPAFFFSYPTPDAVVRFIEAAQGMRAEAADGAGSATDRSGAATQQAAHLAGGGADGRGLRADVAIVGMALRFAGAVDSADRFWQVLADGRSVVMRRPPQRWQEYRDELDELPSELDAIHFGGFLEDIDQFDAAFFQITPVEARALDPQQRLLLELTWEALEDAGIDPAYLAGAPVGTFLGAYTHDYELLTLRGRRLGDIDAYLGTGTALSTAAGRLAYFFDFRGPALTVDTACSSSSSAIFAACQSLNDGSSGLAVAAAVNLLLSPALSIAFARAGMLSPDGVCKTFDSSADGYVRSEGAALLVLKRLDDALRDGDHVHGVIRSIALRQDGRSNGLTAPNGLAQAEMIGRALALAGVSPAEVGYVEAHGTGTFLGDPVEMQALRACYCDGVDRVRPLIVGSVKTNLGHTEAVSGMAGLIKVVLALRHQLIPAHLHLRQLNALLNIGPDQIEVPLHAKPWPAQAGRPRLAAVSSFGFSGTIAHLIVAEHVAPEPTPTPISATGSWPAVISARSPAALQLLLHSWSDYLARDGQGADPAALSRALTRGRGQHAHRRAFTFSSAEDLRTQLTAGTEAPPAAAGGIAFLFTGQGSQYPGMARGLAQTSPLFRAELERCRATMRRHCEVDLFDLLWGEDTSRIDQTRYTQAALFCIEHSLAQWLDRAGIRAGVALGHSVGEFAAACYAGAVDAESAIRLLCARGELMQVQSREGAMAAIVAPVEAVERLIDGYREVSIAAFNGPHNQVVSGDPAQLAEIVRRAEGEGFAVFALPVNRAFHSPLMDSMLDAFFDVARRLDYAEPRIALISNLSGEVRRAAPDAGYWRTHIGAPVRFARSVATLLEQDVATVIEIGPRPVLTNIARTIAGSAAVQWLPTLLTADTDGLARVFASASQANRDVDWRCYPHPPPQRPLPPGLPRYPFERHAYWLQRRDGNVVSALAAAPVRQAGVAPGQVMDALTPFIGIHFHHRLEPVQDAALHAHRLAGRALLPASAYIAAMLEAALKRHKRSADIALVSLSFHHLLFLDPGQAHELQVQVDTPRGLPASVEVRARAHGESAWQSCASATVDTGADSTDVADPVAAASGVEQLSGAEFYRRLQRFGYDYAAPFRAVGAAFVGETAAVAEVEADAAEADDRFALPPWTLDCCLQVALGVLLAGAARPTERLLVPVSVQRLAYFHPLSGALRVHCRYVEDSDGVMATLRIVDQGGRLCCSVSGLRLRYLQRRSLPPLPPAGAPAYVPRWEARTPPATWDVAKVPRWLVLDDGSGYGQAAAQAIAEHGVAVRVLRLGDVAAAGGDAALAAQVGDYLAALPAPAGVVYCACAEAATEHAELSATQTVLRLLRVLATQPASVLACTVLLTQRAQAVVPGERVPAFAAASVWGLVGAFEAEVPHHAVRVVDVSDDGDASAPARLAQARLALQTALHESGARRFEHFAARAGKVFVCRLVSAETGPATPIDADGCYIVAGGLGGLGRLCVHYLHARGAGRIVVLSRNPAAATAPWIAALNRQRDCIALRGCDITVAAQVQAVAAALDAALPLRGLIHAAGVLDDTLLADLTATRLRAVYAPKLSGARRLVENLPLQQADFIWLFSSIVGLFGGAGQANYAAANAALDGYARHLRATGHPCVAVNWGPWKDTGMLARGGQAHALQARQFAALLDPGASDSYFDAVLGASTAQLCIANWRIATAQRSAPLPALLAALADSAAAEPQPARASLHTRMNAAFGAERHHRLRGHIAATIAEITGIDTRRVLEANTLDELGLDSLMYLSLRNHLASDIGSPLDATLAFDHPTLDALTGHLLRKGGWTADAAAAPQAVTPAATRTRSAADEELDEIEALQDDDLLALLGEEYGHD